MAFATMFIVLTWFTPYYICKRWKKWWQVLLAILTGIIASVLAAVASDFILNWINPEIFHSGMTFIQLVGIWAWSIIFCPVAALVGRRRAS